MVVRNKQVPPGSLAERKAFFEQEAKWAHQKGELSRAKLLKDIASRLVVVDDYRAPTSPEERARVRHWLEKRVERR